MKKLVFRIGMLAFLIFLIMQCVFTQKTVEVQPKWEPQWTWVFFVGLLEWQDAESFDSFPQKDRRDEILLNELRKRGVPETQIVYLKDKQGNDRKYPVGVS